MFSIEKSRPRVKATYEQKCLLVSFMETHSDLRKGTLSSSFTIENRFNLWKELTELLNSQGGCIKTPEKWQKCWNDLKCDIRRKIVAQKNTDGNGFGKVTKTFTDIDWRIHSLIKDNQVTEPDTSQDKTPNQLRIVSVKSTEIADQLITDEHVSTLNTNLGSPIFEANKRIEPQNSLSEVPDEDEIIDSKAELNNLLGLNNTIHILRTDDTIHVLRSAETILPVRTDDMVRQTGPDDMVHQVRPNDTVCQARPSKAVSPEVPSQSISAKKRVRNRALLLPAEKTQQVIDSQVETAKNLAKIGQEMATANSIKLQKVEVMKQSLEVEKERNALLKELIQCLKK